MPAAIQTTKRKFHKLLEGLTTPSTSSSTSSLPTAKRPRLTPSSRLTNLPSRRVPLPPQEPDEPLAPSPWSHTAFLKRLKTFTSLSHWSTKPSSVNEVQWARHGWTCSQAKGDFNVVVCEDGCHERRVIDLRPPMKDGDGKPILGTEDASVEPDCDLITMYEKLIDEAHVEGCVWRGEGNACKEDVYRLMIARPSVWQSGLRERYSSFVKLASKTPRQERLICDLDIEETIHLLPEHFFDEQKKTNDNEAALPDDDGTRKGQASDSHEDKEIDRAALAFTLLGWRAFLDFPSSPYAVATCDACFRRLGLWLYTKREGQEDDPMKLDLSQNHRDYCPWISADSQCMTGGLKGKSASEVLRVLIKNNSSFRPSSRSSRPTTAHSQDEQQAEGVGVQDSRSLDDAVSEKSREDIAEEDKKRFAKLRELSRSMGLKRWRTRLGNPASRVQTPSVQPAT